MKLLTFKNVWLSIILFVVLGVANSSAEEQILTLEGAKIRGNQELPTVLYVVPWQAPEIRKLPEKDERLAVTVNLKPLERSEFQRVVKYHESMNKRESMNKE